jgi:hypothetical protein
MNRPRAIAATLLLLLSQEAVFAEEEREEEWGIKNETTLAAVVARLEARIKNDRGDDDGVDYGNHNLRWDDGPSSWDEFGHDNDPNVCRMQTITIEEWESGRYWRGNVPVMVKNVTAGWAANVNWELDEMLRRYPDAEATMGDGRRVGKIGPDAAGRLLSPTTVRVSDLFIFATFSLRRLDGNLSLFDYSHPPSSRHHTLPPTTKSCEGIHHEAHVQPVQVLLRS